MRLQSFLAGCVALVAVAASGSAAAQPCVGFSDVLSTSPFCPNVEWLKNRAVTAGCGAGTTYCPNDSVTRLQMAIFMNRLGTALTPIVLTGAVAAAPVGLAASPATVVCQTPDFALTGANQSFPRRAYVHATSNLSQPSGAGVDVKAEVAVSTNGGAEPRWRGDGREMFFVDRSLRLMSVTVDPQADEFRVLVPQPLFQTRIPKFGMAYRGQLVAAKDGRRFLLNVGPESSVWPSVTVVLNWTAALAQ